MSACDSAVIDLAAQFRDMDFPPAVVLARLRGAGYETYIVGGCVRDALLGREPQDWDIATAAAPERVAALFDYTRPTGLAHGTVTVRLGAHSVEVTSFRADGVYSDGRRPDSVRFGVTAAADFARRDFTVNAIGWNPDGFYDPMDGRGDLARGILRCVGEPERRFAEDALRILRALRFAAQLGLAIDPRTEAAMLSSQPLLSAVAAERVFAELTKLLQAAAPERVLTRHAALLSRYIDPLRCAGLDKCPPTVRWVYVLSALPPERAADCLKKLRSDKALREQVRAILRCSIDGSLPQALRRHGESAVRGRLLMEGRDLAELDALMSDPRRCYCQKHLAIGGEDLLALGIPPGRAVGEMLEHLLDEVMLGHVPNERQALASQIHHIFFNKP